MNNSSASIHSIINLRGLHEESKFASYGTHGGHRSIFCRGCDLYTPMSNNLKGVDIGIANQFRRWYSGEDLANVDYAYFLLVSECRNTNELYSEYWDSVCQRRLESMHP